MVLWERVTISSLLYFLRRAKTKSVPTKPYAPVTSIFFMVDSTGFEPVTSSMSMKRSKPLSYESFLDNSTKKFAFFIFQYFSLVQLRQLYRLDYFYINL